jgi:PTS system nitrogen regulatory IIA component
MNLTDIIDARAVLPHVKAQSKKALLQDLAQSMAKIVAVDQRIIFETLLTREKLGSTGLFARLSTPVAFDSVDGNPVDLVFVLLAPEHAGADHLTALARISRILRDPVMVSKLRGTETAEGLYALLTEPMAAASTSSAA